MFPKISRKIKNKQESVKVQFLTENLELILDKEKCVGCGTCSRVCPKKAVNRGPVGVSRRFPTTDDLIPEVYDPKKCVFCGTCVYMCPFSALTLKVNNEVVNLDDIPIVKQEAVPKLEFEAKKLDSGRIVKQYVSGDYILYEKFTNLDWVDFSWEYYLFNQVTKKNIHLDFIDHFIIGEMEFPYFLCHDNNYLYLYDLLSQSKTIINETSWGSLDGDSVYYRYEKDEGADIFIYSISQNESRWIYNSCDKLPTVRGRNGLLVIAENIGNKQTNITIFNRFSYKINKHL